jgi:uncharacterized protein with von Willebrand factor type A (vWA) domain
MDEKMLLYFEAGAKEFWLCDKQGRMRFFNPEKGRLTVSELVPQFPKKITL